MLQLHGDEGPSFCAEARRRTGALIVKAAQVAGVGDVRRPRALPRRFPPARCTRPRRRAGRPARRHRRHIRLGPRRDPPLEGAADPQRRSRRGQRARGRLPRPTRGPSTRPAARSSRRDTRTPPASRRSSAPSPRRRRLPLQPGPARERGGDGGRAPFRPLRRPVRPRDADARARRARAGVARRAVADPGYAAELAGLLRDFGGRPTPLYEARRLSERLGRTRLPEARGPQPHRLAQAQQRPRAGSAGEADGQAPDHRRDRRRPARRRHGDCLRPDGHGMRHLHGREDTRRQRPNVQRMQLLGATCRARRRGREDAQGGHLGGDPRLGHERREHPLRDRLGRSGPRPIPRSCAISSA